MKRDPRKRPDTNVIRHPHFAVRKLPWELFEHYRKARQIDTIVSTRYYNKPDGAPAIRVEREAEESTADIWEQPGAAYHCALKQLPKQIFRFYQQSQKLNYIQAAEYYEDTEVGTTVEVDLGDVIDFWEWVPAKQGGDYCLWRLAESESTDQQRTKIELPSSPRWTYSHAEPIPQT